MVKQIFTTLLVLSVSYGQPADLYMTKNFQTAYRSQTRSFDGNPGPAYWQNRADYSIDVSLDPSTRIISGTESIQYENHSPDSLNYLIVHLFPNVYKKGTARDFEVEYEDESDGVKINQIKIDGKVIDISAASPAIAYIHNDFKLYLPRALLSGERLKLEIDWQYTLNRHSHMRTGQVDSSSFFVAYFFPRIAVYDDIDGWNDFFYSGRAEFYNDFADFVVSITVPGNYVVWATGELQNSAGVLNEKYHRRRQEALKSDQIVSIIDTMQYRQGVTQDRDFNRWIFKATNVSDFSFATSDHYLWDGLSLVVDQKTDQRVFINSAYNKNAKDFYGVTRLAHEAIQFMSDDFPGIPFPYPAMTVFNGLDEMEYPMMVNDMSFDDSSYVRKVTSHEIFHSYFPFYTGINESKYAWMDEGFASYGDYLISLALDKSGYSSIYYLDRYKANQNMDVDIPIMSNSKFLKKYAYHYNAYAKPAVFLIILRDLVGDQLFKKTIRGFIERWQGKHPTPYDFFYTINDLAGQNLNWLFKPWFFDFGYADLGIKDVGKTTKGYRLTISRAGLFPVPLKLLLTYRDGTQLMIERDVSIWKEGNLEYSLETVTDQEIIKAELAPGILPDADKTNDLFVNGSGKLKY